jgi:hypothetical protein
MTPIKSFFLFLYLFFLLKGPYINQNGDGKEGLTNLGKKKTKKKHWLI